MTSAEGFYLALGQHGEHVQGAKLLIGARLIHVHELARRCNYRGQEASAAVLSAFFFRHTPQAHCGGLQHDTY